MPQPEQGSSPAAQPNSTTQTNSTVSETGDLSSQVDFYSTNDNSPALIEDNNPDVDWRGPSDEGLDADDGALDDEGATEEKAGEVGEEEEGDSEGAGDDEDEAKKDAESEEEPGDEEKPKKDAKTLSISVGDNEYDVPISATIPVTVNGEVENATLQELRDAYSAKSSIRKELEQSKAAKEEISQHRRKMLRDIEKKEVAVVEKEFSVNKARQALAQDDYETALNEIFEHDYAKWNRFDDLMSRYYSEFAKLPADTRRSIQLDRQNKLYEVKQRLTTEAAAMQSNINAFNDYKRSRCTEAGLDEEEVEDAWDGIVDRAGKGEFTAFQVKWLQEATPHQKWETAMSEALAGKTRGRITEVIKNQFPRLENKISDIIKGLEERLSGKYLMKATKEDIAKIISIDYNDGKAGRTAGKKVALTNSLSDKAQPRHRMGEAATQDDEDDLYDQSGRDEPSNQVWGGQFFK